MVRDRLLGWGAIGLFAMNSVASCSVDHRRLKAGPSYAGFWIISAGEAGAPRGGGGADAGEGGAVPNDAGTGGDAGGAPMAGRSNGGGAGSAGTAGSMGLPQLVDGCPDLDFNGTGDCKETLVSNPSFAFDTANWLAGDNADLAWSPENHFQDSPSGSALVRGVSVADADGLGLSAASQCIATPVAARMEAFASAFVKSGQGDGSASLSILFFPVEGCKDSPVGAPIFAASVHTDAWETVSAKQAIPQGTKSALVRLAVTKPYRTPKFEVLFDNILIRTE